jgi:hypothetical protein
MTKPEATNLTTVPLKLEEQRFFSSVLFAPGPRRILPYGGNVSLAGGFPGKTPFWFLISPAKSKQLEEEVLEGG